MNQKKPNDLIHSTSPYLQQHAYNPVDWHTWSTKALQQSKDENKPILLSIGYSACHWCHVMERESFENEDTAAIMNEYFINIKVDREERPDLDHIYMDALQAMTGSGGWPLNIFLTPNLQPFYGGTYFPPIAAYNRKSWREILYLVKNAYEKRKDEVEEQAAHLIEYLNNANKSNSVNISEDSKFFTKEKMLQIAQQMLHQADTFWGGFGNAPKFPQTFSLQFLLQIYYHTGMEPALHHAILSLDKMYMGGIYDHIGGGFARYSTDTEWLAPHFEKMLYDNALLLGIYADAYKITKNKNYKRVIEETITYSLREMQDPLGYFYSALDADSEGVEGKFYTWSFEEVHQLLQADADLFCAVYDISPTGNWENTNIPRLLQPIVDQAATFNLTEAVWQEKISLAKEKLLHVRNARIRPLIDDKILLNWNAMMISALCKSATALQNTEWIILAEKTWSALHENLYQEGDWFHSYKEGQKGHQAFLDDYALLAEAGLQLFYCTGSMDYLNEVKQLIEKVIHTFDTPDQLMYYFTDKRADDVIIRKKEVYDGATASGNSTMANVLWQVGILLNNTAWQERAKAMTLSISKLIHQYPNSFGLWSSVALKMTMPTAEVAIVGNAYKEKLIELQNYFFPHLILHGAKKSDKIFPLLAEKERESDATLIYVCSNYKCLKPVDSAALAATMIQAEKDIF